MRAAILLDQEFQDTEVIYPYYRLQEAGFETLLVGRKAGVVCHGKYGYAFESDVGLEVDPTGFDVVVVPGGNAPDKMRTHKPFVDFVRAAAAAGKLIAAICHGPELLIDAEVVAGKKLTSYVAIRKDLENAGANWSDAEVVVDGRLVTSRKPADLPAFMRETLCVAADIDGSVPRASSPEARA